MSTTPEPEHLYHYTTARGLLGIAQSQELWATHIRYLNEATEFFHTVELARSVRARSAGQFNAGERAFLAYLLDRDPGADVVAMFRWAVDHYVASLSEDPDLLSQWRAYAARNGYAIGWTTEGITAAANREGFRLLRCIYSRPEQLAIVERVLTATVSEWRQRPLSIELTSSPTANSTQEELAEFTHLFQLRAKFNALLGEIATICKNPAFREEREWRLVRSVPIPPADIRFREGRTTIVPYTAISMNLDGLGLPREKTQPMVICGPTPEPGPTQYAVLKMFAPKCQGVSTRISSIPYREW